MDEENKRLYESYEGDVPPWSKWGPYVSERSWGTVREDYSYNGDAWNFFTYEQALSKTYRWGEDGIAGWCDRYQILVFAPAFWNGRDPILKERLFGLTSWEGNHGEDVKEVYFHVDGVPTHSYMKYIYRYPQEEFPYALLREENRKRSSLDPEYEIEDTKIFDQMRYFDIHIEYAKANPEDLCIRMEIFNRSDEAASLHVLPQLWFRNQWAWGEVRGKEPIIKISELGKKQICLIADDRGIPSPSNLSFDYHLNERYFYGPPGGEPLFTDNETRFDNPEFWASRYLKDAFHKKIIKKEESVNPEKRGTKSAIHYFFKDIPPKSSVVLRLRLSDKPLSNPLNDVDQIVEWRKKEADAFYEANSSKNASEEIKLLKRQALAGILWNKQIYLFDVNRWLKGDNPKYPPPETRLHIRNIHWRHLNSMRIMIVPDKWEYPWFAAWDQAFHCLTLALADIEMAKNQLFLLLHDQFQHPNGQIPACEWEFSDMNPPVQAWAALRIHEQELEKTGTFDREFLEKSFHKLLINFAWWVNKVDPSGNNIFEGGFLGMDNISIFDRSQKIADKIRVQQSDGTGWMAMFCLNLMRIALILAKENRVYESLAIKFFEHYVYIAHAMKKRGNQNYELWSEKDGFFYDVLTFPNGTFAKFRLRSLVGIIPLYVIEIIDEEKIKEFPNFYHDFHWFLKNRSRLVESCVTSIDRGGKRKYILALMHLDQLKSVLQYVWNPDEFRSEYGLRSLSKYHLQHPFQFENKVVGYEPGEAIEKIKGGNSNWRGPIWFPTNFLLIDSLKKLGLAFGEKLQVKVKDEPFVDCQEMAKSFAERLLALFTRKDQDPFCFYEYYNPETGKGLGASHQAGWTALIANLIADWKIEK